MYGDESRVSAAPTLSKAPEQPPLMRTYDDLVRAQSMAADRLEALTARLQPLLGSLAPTAGGTNAAGRASSSDFDAMLIGRVESTHGFVERLEDILRRLSI